jgi:hypothetical protein
MERTPRRRASCALCLGLVAGLVLAPQLAVAFSATGNIWDDAKARLYTGHLNAWWSVQLRDAAETWNDEAPWFEFEVSTSGLPACDDEILLNGARFDTETCGGAELGEGILAVAEWEVDEDGNTVRAGITFNDGFSWAIFDGPIPEGSQDETVIDFRRVALHELGHFLGLGHEDTEPAVMSSVVSDVSSLQPDDIAGVEALYGPPPPPEAEPLEPEVQCQVDQLKAAAKLCKKHLKCEGSLVKSPAKDPVGAKRDACVAKALESFRNKWDGAIADTVDAGGVCNDQDSSAIVEAEILTAVGALEAAIGAGDPLVKADGKMRQKLMVRTGALCDQNLDAWEKAVTRGDAGSVGSDLVKALTKFLKKGSSAVAGGAAAGVAYDGADLDALATDTETLTDSLSVQIVP